MADVHSTPSPASSQPVPSPDPEAIPYEKWVAGEETILQVLNCVYPTFDSEDKRRDIIEYLQELVRSSVGVEVFPYGSVPLKTYLPDGDIDFTAIYKPEKGYNVPQDVLHLLQAVEQFGTNEFKIRDVTFIDAEVKLVKCIVSGIVVDISFNQLGGLSTLCFLEEVDREIGNNHLFKRSIILIKTWCFYESRILGATYGLISTYALAVLVLCVFHVFGASIRSPLMALYRFLDYYGKFDWGNYCISLNGLVKRSSLPNIVVENPLNETTGAFISDDFLHKYIAMFTLNPIESKDVPFFVWKYLNIIDPLKETNNLGRSVQQANSYRILSALRYGARTLARVLQLPNENIGDGIKKFFATTLQRHKSKDIPDVSLMFDTLSLSSFSEAEYIYDMDSDFSNSDLDSYLSGMDNVSYVGSGEASDLDVFQDLSQGTTDEVANSDNGHDDVADDFLADLNNPDVNAGFSDTETLDLFADLTGDYLSSLRSLLVGQRYHNYAINPSLAVEYTPFQQQYEVAYVPVPLPLAWYHQGSPPPPPPPPPQVNPNAYFYSNGQTSTQTSHHFRMEERNPLHGTAPYYPITKNFFGGPSRVVHGPAVPNRPQEQAPVRSGPRNKVYTQRKLVFGSFPPIKPVTRSTSQAPPPNYVACGLSQGSDQVEKMFLQNEEEFPPLAA